MKIIKLFVSDVDGVLTDGRLFYTAQGEAGKFFHVHDGQGLKLLIQQGMHVAIISARHSAATQHRLSELAIPHVFLGVTDKLLILKNLCNQLQIDLSEVAYMGDDLADLTCMQQVGLPIAPANAVSAIKEVARYTTLLRGGEGAVREAADWLMIGSVIPA